MLSRKEQLVLNLLLVFTCKLNLKRLLSVLNANLIVLVSVCVHMNIVVCSWVKDYVSIFFRNDLVKLVVHVFQFFLCLFKHLHCLGFSLLQSARLNQFITFNLDKIQCHLNSAYCTAPAL